MAESPKGADRYVGIKHFLKFMREGQPEWALFAVRAPIEEVSTTFAEFRLSKKRAVDVPRRLPTDDIDIAPVAAAVQMKGNPWTVVFRSLTDIEAVHLERVPQEARTLSERLGTRAVTFLADNTSGAMRYEIFERAQSLESVTWEADKLSNFQSTLRQMPEQNSERDGFVNDVFHAEGIYVPCCYPQRSEQNEWLVVEKASADAIERADLIDIGEGANVATLDGSSTPRVRHLTIVFYFTFLLSAAWLIFRCFTLGWTASRVTLLCLISLGFVICRGKWRRAGQRSRRH